MPIPQLAALNRLLAGARNPHAPDTGLFARLIAVRLEAGDLTGLGLGHADFAALMTRHFPGATLADALPEQPLADAPPFVDELIALLQ